MYTFRLRKDPRCGGIMPKGAVSLELRYNLPENAKSWMFIVSSVARPVTQPARKPAYRTVSTYNEQKARVTERNTSSGGPALPSYAWPTSQHALRFSPALHARCRICVRAPLPKGQHRAAGATASSLDRAEITSVGCSTSALGTVCRSPSTRGS
jgi:hypothetical protein